MSYLLFEWSYFFCDGIKLSFWEEFDYATFLGYFVVEESQELHVLCLPFEWLPCFSFVFSHQLELECFWMIFRLSVDDFFWTLVHLGMKMLRGNFRLLFLLPSLRLHGQRLLGNFLSFGFWDWEFLKKLFYFLAIHAYLSLYVNRWDI